MKLLPRAANMRHGEMRRRTSAACLIVLVTMVGCGLPADGSRLGQLRGTPMHTPISKPDLVLVDTEGRPFDFRKQTEGYLTLLFFGYTFCPDVCPVQMATLGAAFEDLSPEIRSRIKVVFVSTDPERDTPERLRSWLDEFDKSFVGLSGPIGGINEALASMMLPGVAVLPPQGDEDPLIGHPAAVLVFGFDGLARIRYGFGVRRADWAHDLELMANEAS